MKAATDEDPTSRHPHSSHFAPGPHNVLMLFALKEVVPKTISTYNFQTDRHKLPDVSYPWIYEEKYNLRCLIHPLENIDMHTASFVNAMTL